MTLHAKPYGKLCSHYYQFNIDENNDFSQKCYIENGTVVGRSLDDRWSLGTRRRRPFLSPALEGNRKRSESALKALWKRSESEDEANSRPGRDEATTQNPEYSKDLINSGGILIIRGWRPIAFQKKADLNCSGGGAFSLGNYHHIIMSSYHHIVISSYHHIIISSYHHITISSYHHLIIFGKLAKCEKISKNRSYTLKILEFHVESPEGN